MTMTTVPADYFDELLAALDEPERSPLLANAAFYERHDFQSLPDNDRGGGRELGSGSATEFYEAGYSAAVAVDADEGACVEDQLHAPTFRRLGGR